jgi:HEAT repeat protein
MIKALGRTRDPRVIPTLRQVLLHDRWESNQVDAVRSIADVGGNDAVGALREVCHGKYLSPVRGTALRMLVQLLGPRAKNEVQAMLHDDDRYVKAVAQQLLPNVADASDLGRLNQAIQSTDVAQRRMAARALTNVKSPNAVPRLLAALWDSDEKVRRDAARALRGMRDPSAVPGLLAFVQSPRKNPLRGEAVETLAATPGDEAKACLCLLLLKHPEADLRLRVVYRLQYRPGSNRDQDVRNTLQVAMNDDADEKVRRKAKELWNTWQSLDRIQEHVSQQGRRR